MHMFALSYATSLLVAGSLILCALPAQNNQPQRVGARIIGFPIAAPEIDGISVPVFAQTGSQTNVIYLPPFEFVTDNSGKVQVDEIVVQPNRMESRAVVTVRRSPPGFAAKVAERLRDSRLMENIQALNVLPAEIVNLQIRDVTPPDTLNYKFNDFSVPNFVGQEVRLEARVPGDRFAELKDRIQKGGLSLQIVVEVPVEQIEAQSGFDIAVDSLRDLSRLRTVLGDAAPPDLDAGRATMISRDQRLKIEQRMRDHIALRMRVQPGSPSAEEMRSQMDFFLKELIKQRCLDVNDDESWQRLEQLSFFGDLKPTVIRDFLKDVKTKAEAKYEGELNHEFTTTRNTSSGAWFWARSSVERGEVAKLNLKQLQHGLNENSFKLEQHGEIVIPVALKIDQLDLSVLDRRFQISQLFEKSRPGMGSYSMPLYSTQVPNWKIESVTVEVFEGATPADKPGTLKIPPVTLQPGSGLLTRTTVAEIGMLPPINGAVDRAASYSLAIVMYDRAGQPIFHVCRFTGVRSGEIGRCGPVGFYLLDSKVIAILRNPEDAWGRKVDAVK